MVWEQEADVVVAAATPPEEYWPGNPPVSDKTRAFPQSFGWTTPSSGLTIIVSLTLLHPRLANMATSHSSWKRKTRTQPIPFGSLSLDARVRIRWARIQRFKGCHLWCLLVSRSVLHCYRAVGLLTDGSRQFQPFLYFYCYYSLFLIFFLKKKYYHYCYFILIFLLFFLVIIVVLFCLTRTALTRVTPSRRGS